MSRYAAVTFCALVLAGCTLPPCPEGHARDNDRQCVAVAQPLPAGFVADKPAEPNVFDQFDGQAPTRDEFIADQDAIAAFNREQEVRRAQQDAEWEVDYQARRAQRAADDRTDRLVQAQQETQQELRRIGDKLD